MATRKAAKKGSEVEAEETETKGAKKKAGKAAPKKADKAAKASGAVKAPKAKRGGFAKKSAKIVEDKLDDREYDGEAEVDEEEEAPATRVKGSSLVVVESPAKAKTIKKYLGAGYVVKASVGHVMDLPGSKIGVDIEHDFEPVYEVIEGKEKVLADIEKAAKNASRVLLATDPDREGEAIAWHISDYLKGHKIRAPMQRVLFNEITKKAINEAIQQPRELNNQTYDAQQARRVLDRLVGYKISPILWKKVQRGLSAGRVQSVAVRLVVEREEEIKKFVPVEYWSVEADLKAALPPQFRAKLIKVDGKKAELNSGAIAQPLAKELEKLPFVVSSVEKKERRRNAPAPFITSKMQQEAANRLGFTAKKTMTLAQKLYEGVDLGDEGQTALITYMRTDSVRLSPDAITGAREYIEKTWGKDHMPAEPVIFKTKKSAQDAHEAIRPTSLEYPPKKVQQYLEFDMFRLYELIWNRFVACQMAPAVFDQTTADIGAGRATFRATGQTLKFAGYLAAYGQEAVQDVPPEEAGAEKMEGEDEEKGDVSRQLPPLEANQKLDLVKLIPEQHFTQPPPRFSEASLVKELEEKGIGRPSTYAAILSTIEAKKYVEKRERVFHPSDLGKLVTELLVAAFPNVLDVAFTARMEEELDEVEEGKVDWVKLLREFYGPFEKTLALAEEQMRDVKREEQATDLKCEKCGSPMVIKWGRNGRFLACSGYPECKNTKDFIEKDGKIQVVEDIPTDEVCPTCGKPMVNKRGRFGRFYACSDYPACKTTRPITLKGVVCPQDGGGLAEKRSRFGRTFFSCVNYPNCKFAAWDRPVPGPCPKCASPYLLSKFSKRDGAFIACPNKECGYRRENDAQQQAAQADADKGVQLGAIGTAGAISIPPPIPQS
ncbi:MAG: type I DNA topoisomerase [Deltaproteobacteria bacterium]|nr:type I DNA topoisomerase [Deltaproteobacteria bacterium]